MQQIKSHLNAFVSCSVSLLIRGFMTQHLAAKERLTNFQTRSLDENKFDTCFEQHGDLYCNTD